MHGLGKDPLSAPEEARAIIQEWIGAWRTDGLGPFTIETAATIRQEVGQAGFMFFYTCGWRTSFFAKAVTYCYFVLGWAILLARWRPGFTCDALSSLGH